MVRRACILLMQSVLLVWSMIGCSVGRSTGDLEGTVVARAVATLESAKTASIAAEVPPEPTATPVPEPTAIPEPNATPPAKIETQEYAVYSAMIQQNPIGFDLGPSILIRARTVSGLDSFERALKEGRPLAARLVDSYRSRNTIPYALDPNLDVELDYALMPEEEFAQIFLRGGSASARFHERYPEAGGVVSFSRVGFDANGDEALVLMGYVCGDLCAAGGLYLLVREKGSWRIRESLIEWMA